MKIKQNLKYTLSIAGSLLLFFAIFITGCKDEQGKFDSTLSKINDSIKLNEELRNQFDASVTNQLLFKTDIYRALAQTGVTNLLNCNISHFAYKKVNKKWLELEFSVKLREMFFRDNVLNWYEVGAFHCEDYALGAVYLSRTLNRNDKNRIKGASIAVGSIYYVLDTPLDSFTSTHSVNFAITEENEVVFYEPQTQTTVKLSKAEINSIYYWSL